MGAAFPSCPAFLQLQFGIHFFYFCRQTFPQEHGLAVGKSQQVGEHPIPGNERVLFANVIIDQHTDIHWQPYPFQPAGIFLRLPDDLLIFPVTVCDVVHDTVHADEHELVQCRIFFQSNPSFRGVVAYLCFGGLASGK